MMLVFIGLMLSLLGSACGSSTPSVQPAPTEAGAAAQDETTTPPTAAGETPTAQTAAPGETPTPQAGTTEATPLTAAEAPVPAVQVGLELVAEGFGAPILLLSPPDSTTRRFVVDQVGVVRILTSDGALGEEPFLDIRDRLVQLYPSKDDERGLLGFAFHPKFRENGRFYLFYTTPRRPEAPAGWDHTNVLAEWRVAADNPNRADPASERILLQFDQRNDSHSAGTLIFGPTDGYLYVGLGDGLEERTHPQDLETLLGSILRLDVDGAEPYAVPEDNPFVGQPGLDEIFAYGFRHPWRFSADPESGTLYVAEPAWVFHWQEVNVVQAGGNYGWNAQKTKFCYEGGQPTQDCLQGSKGEQFVAPLVEYGPEVGQIISGVYRYRGKALPELAGRLIFTEWGHQVEGGPKLLSAIAPSSGTGPWTLAPLEIVDPAKTVAPYFWSMGQDAEGELYVLTMGSRSPVGTSGQVFKVVPAP